MNNTSLKLRTVLTPALLLAAAVSLPVSADTGHAHGNPMGNAGHRMGADDHMMNNSEHKSNMQKNLRHVMGEGRVNKVMADRKMVNISHEPMPELKWPKMRMNFKTAEGVALDGLKPGQEVIFTLEVDNANNYLIKDIKTK